MQKLYDQDVSGLTKEQVKLMEALRSSVSVDAPKMKW